MSPLSKLLGYTTQIGLQYGTLRTRGQNQKKLNDQLQKLAILWSSMDFAHFLTAL